MIPVALFDACVLFPPSLRDFLVWLAISGACRARWSGTIHDEWIRNVLVHRPTVLKDSLDRCRELMDESVPDSLVMGFEALVAGLALPDPDDRHVLAAAIHGRADCIVTFNLKDFPKSSLSPYRIEAVHPDDSVPKGEDEMLIDWHRMFPFELFVVAGLALWPPFLPGVGIPFGDSVTWSDLNPGRRFVKAMGAMRGLGIVPSRDKPQDMNKRFCEIQDAICRALAWPTPQFLAKAWFEHFETSTAEMLWNALDGSSPFRLENSKILLRARLERPSDIALNNVDVQSLGVESSPGMIYSLAPGKLHLKPT